MIIMSIHNNANHNDSMLLQAMDRPEAAAAPVKAVPPAKYT